MEITFHYQYQDTMHDIYILFSVVQRRVLDDLVSFRMS